MSQPHNKSFAWPLLRTNLVAQLAEAGLEEPLREVRWLACHILHCDPAQLFLRDQLSQQEAELLMAAVKRRASREPAAFIVGQAGFWNQTLAVSRETLIPRADSEALIEALLELRPERTSIRTILDLGTGTGCLLLAALSEYARAFGIGVDLAADAVALAAANARMNGLAERSAFLAGSWDTALVGQFDVVLSNPPYIPKGDLAGLMPEVVDYEPMRALDGGTDGLDAYRMLADALPRLLVPGGLGVLELGIGQGADVSRLMRAKGLQVHGLRADFGGIERALTVEKPA